MRPETIRLAQRIHNMYCDFLERVLEKLDKRQINYKQHPEYMAAAACIQEQSDKNLESYRKQLLGIATSTLKQTLSKVVDSVQKEISEYVGTIYQNKLTAANEKGLAVFPEHTKFFFSLGTVSILVLEHPPQPRTVHFNPSFAAELAKLATDSGTQGIDQEQSQFLLGFPYLIFVVKLHSDANSTGLWVFQRTTPLTSLDDTLYKLNLPNVNKDSGQMCLNAYTVPPELSLAVRANQVIHRFWSGLFTQVWLESFNSLAKQDSRYSSLWRWEAETRRDSLFCLNTEFEPYKNNLRQLIKESMPAMLIEKEVGELKSRVGKLINSQLENDMQQALVAALSNNHPNGFFQQGNAHALELLLNRLIALQISEMQLELNNLRQKDIEGYIWYELQKHVDMLNRKRNHGRKRR